MASCPIVDETFGPYAGEDCRGGFDFTLLFEESILSILPLCLTLLVAVPRIFSLWSRSQKVARSFILPLKLVTWFTLAGFELALVVLWAQASVRNQASIPSTVLGLLAALVLALLSYLEHLRTVRPSLLLNGFLALTLLFDVARSRSYSLQQYNNLVSVVFTSRVGVKLILVLLEAHGKRKQLLPEYRSYPPEATAGVYSRALFLWLIPLFRNGFSNALSVDDLFPLDNHLKSERLYEMLQSAWERGMHLPNMGPHSLLGLTFRRLRWPILAVVAPRAALIGFNFCQPFLINRSISYSQQESTAITDEIGYGLIGAFAIVYIGIAVSTGQYQHLTYRAIAMMRGALVSMLYNKATRVDLSGVEPSSALTLMSADIERITQGMQTGHEIWANIIEVGVAIYLLQRQLGAACAVPIGVALLSLGGSIVATTFVMQRQALWLEAIERRIAATAAMLNSMKGVKMCGLTDVLRQDLHRLRVQELDISKKFRKLLIWTMAISYTSPVVAPIATFAVFSALARGGNTTLDTARVFTSLSIFLLMTEPLGSLIMSLSAFMGGVGSVHRIQEFLCSEPRVDKRRFSSLLPSATSSSIGFDSGKSPQKSSTSLDQQAPTPPQSSHAVSIENACFGWDKETPVLKSISMTVPRAQITMVVGPVGCGKSTLLKGILGELPLTTGDVHLSSLRIAFCDQTPWHPNGTVQESIVGHADFDQRWYALVVRSCALDDDLGQLAQGDKTRIGSKGVALSGGQSQRLALARAVYSQRDIIVMDDSLSGLDAHTENRIWHNLFGREGLLRRLRSTVLIASSSAKRLPYSDHIVVLNKEGDVTEQGSFDRLRSTGGYVAGFDLPPPDWDVTPETDEKAHYDAPPRYSEPTPEKVTEEDVQAEANRRTGDAKIYLYYVNSVGWIPSIIFIVAITIFIFGISFPTLWVKWWASANAEAPNQRLEYYLGIYGMLGGIALIALIISCWQLIITMVPRSGVNFHRTILTTVLNAPLSFFSTTDTGVTLNRFSQDLQLIDMELPIAALNTFATFVLCLGQMVLIGIASPYAATSFPLVIATVYVIQLCYLRTSRQLRFLDLESKAPLYTQFTEMLSGLATIRAFGWQSHIERKSRDLLDRSQRPFYLLYAVQRWLTLVLDLVVAGIAVLLIGLVVALRGRVSPGYVGVALVNVIQFSQSVKLLVGFWTQLETHIGSVSRIKTFSAHAVNENLEGEDQTPPPDWPAKGKIEFDNVSAGYSASAPVISSFTLRIAPGEKVAIVGRTGSGKSSLLLTLFRMLELGSGRITVDGQALHRLPRQTVRSQLIGVPQDACLLPGSVRLNADPTQQSSDKDIMAALKKVQLWDVVVGKGDESKYTHPLDVLVDDLHFSAGQRQLFCLCRALLRADRSKVVVLDEATSCLDHSTDTHIQKVLRSTFVHHTVLAVAHKLDTILDFDKVVVMDQGRVIESGPPHQLLEVEGSLFRGLWKEGDGLGAEEELASPSDVVDAGLGGSEPQGSP